LRSNDRYPDYPLSFDRQGIEIDLRQVPGEIKASQEYWETGKAIIDDVVDNRLNDGVRKGQVNHLSVFAFARLPLLIYLGSKLDDTYAVDIYQRHRATERWAWPVGASNVTFVADTPICIPGEEALLILNASGSIQPDEIPKDLQGLPAYSVYPKGCYARTGHHCHPNIVVVVL
jgi:hypothetical protein